MSKSFDASVSAFRRHLYPLLHRRLSEDRRFIQVLSGPRQVGKTTLARQIGERLGVPVHYVSADEPTFQDRAWLAQQWEIGRTLTRSRGDAGQAMLVVEEVQKIVGWSETVKRLWDEDSHAGTALKVMLLGSSPLLVQQGLTESLAGRFEITPVPHWSYQEMREAFGWTLEQFLYFGGYPGSAALIGDEERWRRYIIDALIETTISRDILLLSRVDKPAILRRLFHLACEYSGVGAHLLNTSRGTGVDVQYWLDRNREVDFVLVSGRAITAIEVKSTARRDNPPGVDAFVGAFSSARPLLVGAQGIPISEFLTRPAPEWAAPPP